MSSAPREPSLQRHAGGARFDKILIANRGEIACRVMRTARRMGYRTVAVFSEADAQAPHVALADEAVYIGAPPAAQSYLSIAALLDAARATGAAAVHPGYGFLSERADFAQACTDAGLVFIGPPPAAIRAMGDKALAKRRMLEAGVPCAPGYLGDDQSDERLLREATALGYPLLVKAVAGGGGRGMRLVRSAGELAAALAGARREAESAFGSGTLMLERLIERGRHIEIQVFADTHGNVVHLGERDCSAQRRRQKVIEEAPSPVVDAALRAAMGRDAVAAARAVGYVGAGTVEFIVDHRMQHCFLEMNTRLQVEHPVTECITGLDLVEWQLRIAAGEPLPLTQQQVRFDGHAIEARLYTEDPAAQFQPQTGRVLHWRPDAARALGVRVDDGIAEGATITPHYDAMVAKLVAHGRDRADAARRLVAALDAAPLLGVRTNARLLRELLRSEAFASAAITTDKLDAWSAADAAIVQRPPPGDAAWLIAAAARIARAGIGWRPASLARHGLTLQCGDARRTMRVAAGSAGIEIVLDGRTHMLHLAAAGERRVAITFDGRQRHAIVVDDGRTLHLALDGEAFAFTEASPWPQRDVAVDPRRARAPVAGTVAQVLVRAGDAVVAGQQLVSVEAMKMEMWLLAAAPGTVRVVHAVPQATVASGTVLVELETTTQ
ncbi:MAG: ATP-grasp domain-containing protein [Ideonella sp.]|nr:ATP-grasp domain-containing protein [Ideonella sp.]MCC7458537.1 ATP-grasp domain-containing protein [Nitrospira sp.]